jgi:predicted ATPase
LPYAPFVDAWIEHVELAGLPASANPFTSFEPVPHEMQENTLKLFQAFESALFQSSGSAPAVIIVEDLHWADDSTLRLFHELHLRAATRPLLLVGTYRESDVATRGMLHSLLTNLKRQRQVERIRLEPLSAADTYAQIEALAGGESSASFAKRVYQMSSGNPLFTEEIVLDALERGGPSGSVAIPESLADVVEERVSRLGRAGQAMVRAASVTGESFRFEWIRAASGLDEAEAMDALETALRTRLLEEDGERYRFRHDLVREAIYSSLSRERRKTLHGAIADAIGDVGLAGDASGRDRLLAHHFQLAGRPLEALPHLLAAGEFAMSRTGFEETRVLFETALAIMEAHGETSGERRFRLLSALGSAHLALSNLDTARSYFETAAALPPTADGWSLTAVRRARMLRMAAVALMTAGDLARVDELLADALALLPDVSAERPHVLYHLAQLRWSEGKHGDAYELAERVLVEAEKANDPEGLAKGYEMLALSCHSMGAWREGIEYVEKRKEIVGDAVDVAETFDAHL